MLIKWAPTVNWECGGRYFLQQIDTFIGRRRVGSRYVYSKGLLIDFVLDQNSLITGSSIVLLTHCLNVMRNDTTEDFL